MPNEDIQSATREQEFSGSEALEMARRRYQRGELKLRGKVWYGRWREDVKDLDGTVRRIQKNEPIGNLADLPTQKLARRELESRISDVNSLTYRPRTLATFEQFAKRWRESVLVNEKRSAQSSDASILTVHLEPRWGSRQLKEIEADPEGLQAWAASLKVAPKTQRNIVGLMRRMLDISIEWGYMKYNPLARVRLKPMGLKTEEFAFSFEQVLRVLKAAPEPYNTMYWLAWETGIRAGEVLGFPISNLDLNNPAWPRIRVRQKLWRGEIETVKSRKGVREIKIGKRLKNRLAEFSKGRSGLLFVDSAGQPIDYDHALKEELQPLLEKLGLPRCGFHAFRHGNATLMDEQGVPMATRMARLGHEKTETTFGYTHVVDDAETAFVEYIDNRLATEMIQ